MMQSKKDTQAPSHLRGKQIAEWKAANDKTSLEVQLASKGNPSTTTTYTVSAGLPPSPPLDPSEPEPMDVEEENPGASSAVVPAEDSEKKTKPNYRLIKSLPEKTAIAKSPLWEMTFLRRLKTKTQTRSETLLSESPNTRLFKK